MDQFETIEGKILYITYNLYKQNRICIQQKNEIKDMLISKNHRIEKLLQELRGEHNVSYIENSLETINDLSPRDFDDSLSNSYKNKRPKRFKFVKSNFPRNIDPKEMRANEDTDSLSRNSNQQFEFDSRRRVYSLAADSC
ncbi:unnamed protein product (macronuclear) [Paramecium tetraurelia]|uniref:Uncharacterized protein n=1 Tax=Paramecium tetraurelia TaxID=5888 RepID=A0CV76_PARTE|nr:uncharacterized protein GSPATT00010861001 [Paramecium tetraurelia]CAK74693.1 unnamed protein product [Paramecium tetraurelia]|eukprot:XP_001442090.1 hypothetical protein (macronuclear) [Paramecium tetraurelia strain d4-2]